MSHPTSRFIQILLLFLSYFLYIYISGFGFIWNKIQNYEEFGNYLIKLVRPYYRNTKLSDVDLENAIFALDSTTISTSIKLATWALGKYGKGSVKTHLWSAICAYLLMALIKAKTGSKYTITEVATLLSVSIFEKMDLEQLLTHPSDRLVSLLSNQNVKDQQLSLIF